MKHIRKRWFGGHSGHRILRSEKGIALVMVLVLSLISLAMVATLIFLVTQGTRFSGFNKRYETAREAGYGGIDVIKALINKGGELKSLKALLNLESTTSTLEAQCDCGDTSNPDIIRLTSCLCQKLCAPTLSTTGAYNWFLSDGTRCDNNQNPTSNYDLKFQLAGFGTNYDAFGKIVDTSAGNSDLSGLNLGGTAVVAASGSITPPSSPYLYTIEITAQDEKYSTNQNLRERGRLSVLYAY